MRERTKKGMKTEEKLALIKEVGEEIIGEDYLKQLLEKGGKIVAYDGFEPSGQIHIAQGIMRAINVNKMAKAGITFKMLVADWHGWANNKLGGDLSKIQEAGQYMIEVWKLCGMDLKNVEFVWASELVKDDKYWKLVMQIARANTVKRIMRCGEIMGRKEGEVQSAAQILYPCMQAADIFYLGADICQLGMDQRKVNVLAREIAPKLGHKKPVIVNHHMLMGLGEPPKGEGAERVLDLKMSKSKPDTAIFMTDDEKTITKKINKAYCPEKIVKENPILEYCKYIIFELLPSLEIERPEKFGGKLSIGSYQELENMYEKGELHPADLKSGVARSLSTLITPVRERIRKNAKLKKLQEKILSYKVTR